MYYDHSVLSSRLALLLIKLQLLVQHYEPSLTNSHSLSATACSVLLRSYFSCPFPATAYVLTACFLLSNCEFKLISSRCLNILSLAEFFLCLVFYFFVSLTRIFLCDTYLYCISYFSILQIIFIKICTSQTHCLHCLRTCTNKIHIIFFNSFQ